MKKNQGFTLIEVLVVIAIISLMMVWLLPQIAGGQRSVDEAQCRKQLQDIYAASVVYKSRKLEPPAERPGRDLFLAALGQRRDPQDR
jgi:prepilin-type N-terminal cleavage/methylation domain-containing protein